MKIDHIGIAVAELEQIIERWKELTGVEPVIEEVPDEGVRVAVFKLEGGRIELLEPLSEKSPIYKFLKDRGEGIHHIALDTGDLPDFIQARKDMKLIYPENRSGAEGILMNFVHPKTMGRVLLEVMERK